MSGWADRKIQEAAQQEKDERDKNEKQAREHALVLADAPVLWDQLIQTLSSEIDLYNAAFPSQLSLSSLTISEPDKPAKMITSSQNEILLSFDRKVPKVYYELKKPDGPQRSKRTTAHGSFAFDIQKNNEVWLFHANTKGIFDGPYDIPASAGFLLDLLVD